MIIPDKLNPEFDINNIDFKQLIALYGDKLSLGIKIILGAGSLILTMMFFNGYQAQDKALHVKISQVRQKLEVLKTRDAAVENLNNFKSSLLPKIDESRLITIVSDDAKEFNVTFNSLTPNDSRDMGLYDVINISINAVSDNFKDMMLFLRKIERSDYPIRIDSWSGSEGEDGKITFMIQINAVLIHP